MAREATYHTQLAKNEVFDRPKRHPKRVPLFAVESGYRSFSAGIYPIYCTIHDSKFTIYNLWGGAGVQARVFIPKFDFLRGISKGMHANIDS